ERPSVFAEVSDSDLDAGKGEQARGESGENPAPELASRDQHADTASEERSGVARRLPSLPSGHDAKDEEKNRTGARDESEQGVALAPFDVPEPLRREQERPPKEGESENDGFGPERHARREPKRQ